MPTPRNPIAATVSISLVLLLQGCASTKEDVFPDDMRPMRAVYDDHFARLKTRGIEGVRAELQKERTRPPAQTAGTGPLLPVNKAPGVQLTALEGAEGRLAGYTRQVHNEIEALFPTLPNSDLIMYVYPHLSEDGAPVPGYATAFPFYERVEYALPGEVP